jgi:hypothetical protein
LGQEYGSVFGDNVFFFVSKGCQLFDIRLAISMAERCKNKNNIGGKKCSLAQ